MMMMIIIIIVIKIFLSYHILTMSTPVSLASRHITS